MSDPLSTAGFGGGCHWCTEAVFQSLAGVAEVKQGWISSVVPEDSFSEAVLVTFDEDVIKTETLIAIHLHTHSCTSDHPLRSKYRSAVYVFNETQAAVARQAIKNQQSDFAAPVITRVLQFQEFRENIPEYLNYYYSDTAKPFCENFITPKLRALMQKYSDSIDPNRFAVITPSTK